MATGTSDLPDQLDHPRRSSVASIPEVQPGPCSHLPSVVGWQAAASARGRSSRRRWRRRCRRRWSSRFLTTLFGHFFAAKSGKNYQSRLKIVVAVVVVDVDVVIECSTTREKVKWLKLKKKTEGLQKQNSKSSTFKSPSFYFFRFSSVFFSGEKNNSLKSEV